jgi:hypothetical protein
MNNSHQRCLKHEHVARRCPKHEHFAQEMSQIRACRTADVSNTSKSHRRCTKHEHVAREMSNTSPCRTRRVSNMIMSHRRCLKQDRNIIRKTPPTRPFWRDFHLTIWTAMHRSARPRPQDLDHKILPAKPPPHNPFHETPSTRPCQLHCICVHDRTSKSFSR